MPRGRDYQAEYQRRRRQYRELPPSVAAGHGAVPPFIARKAERGELSSREKRLYKRQLAAYERTYGPAAGGRKGAKRPGTRHEIPGTFDSREDAELFAEGLGISEEFVQVRRRGGEWRLILLR